MLVDKFLEYLEIERKYSALTIIAYKKDIEQFLGFVEYKNINKISTKDVRLYLSSLLSLGLEETSINRKLSSLKSFFKFLLLTEVIDKLPTAGIKNLKLKRKIIIPFGEDEMLNLLEGNRLKSNDFVGLRDRLIVEIFYTTGIRREEMVGLTWRDVNLVAKEINIKGKGGKRRIIPVNQTIISLFENYKIALSKEFDEKFTHIFITEKGENIYSKLVYNIVKSYLSTISEKTKKSPHMLRHSFATHMLNNGAEINAIKELLGHSSLAATQIYTHNNIEELKKVFKLNHPREN